MSSRRRVIDNALSLFVLQGSNYILSLLTLPYLVRTLGPNRFGAVAFAMATMQALALLTDFGFNYTGTRQLAIHRDDPHKVHAIVSAVMSIKALLLALSFAIFLGIVLLAPRARAEWKAFLICYLIVVGTALFPSWIFQGLERMRFVAIAVGGSRLLLIPLIFVFVHGPKDYLWMAFLQSANFIVAALISIPILLRIHPLKWVRPTIHEMRSQIADSFHPFLAAVMGTLISGSSVFFLGFSKNLDIVGGYASMERIARAEVVGLTPVTQAVYPMLSAKFARSHHEGRSASIKVALALLSFAGIVMGLIALFHRQITLLAYGHKLLPYASTLGWFQLWAIGGILNNLLGVQYLLAAGHSKAFGMTVFWSSLITVVLFIVLVPRTTTGGAQAAMIAGEFLQAGLMLWQIIRVERKTKSPA
jgi:polysaccharide transporter, PST family